MKTIIDTWNCYMGYSTKENCYITGSYSELSSSDEIEGSIEWDQDAWYSEKQYFMNYLDSVVSAYERKYKVSVTHIGMIGNVGTWRGNTVGGKIIDYGKNPLDHMGDVDAIKVCVDQDILSIHGYHHDGCHCFNLFLLTENKLRKWAPGFLQWGDYNCIDLQSIRDHCAPIKYTVKEQGECFRVA